MLLRDAFVGRGGGKVANVYGRREVMRYTECDVIYGRLWEDRWAVESGEQNCIHLGGLSRFGG